MDTMLSPERIRGPNSSIGYFPSKTDEQGKDDRDIVTIEACEKDFKDIMRRFSADAIRFISQSLAAGEINGSFSRSDLFGKLAIFCKDVPETLCARIGRARGLNNPAEYWFWQISPKFINGKKICDRCLFTETTIRWCDDMTAEKSPGAK